MAAYIGLCGADFLLPLVIGHPSMYSSIYINIKNSVGYINGETHARSHRGGYAYLPTYARSEG
jgi:hypothetical protein